MPNPLLEPYYKEMGKRLRYYRECQLMTQDELAERVGLSGRQSISAYENARMRLPMYLAVQMCRALSITMDELGTGEPDGSDEEASCTEYNQSESGNHQ